MGWDFFGHGRPAADDSICGSGLNHRQWLILARLLDDIGWRGPLSAEQRDQLKPLLETTAKNIPDTPALRHLETYLREGDPASLDSAAQALAPGYDNPWLLISKSL